jgi:deazaflavin-dependent oxidoreductase (nitroreductase family)
MTKDQPEEPQFLYLTTVGRNSGQPREVEIWFTRRDGRFYVISEMRERAQWVRNILANSAVEVRVASEVFRARARSIDPSREPALAEAVRQLSRAKYGWGEGLIVELTPQDLKGAS